MDRLMNVVGVLSVLLTLLVLLSVRRAHIRVEYSGSWLAAGVLLLALAWRARTWGANRASVGDFETVARQS